MPFFMSLHAGNLELVILCFTCCLFTRKFSTWEQNLLQGWSSSLSSSPQVWHHRLCLNFWYFVRTKYAMPWNFPFSFSHMMSGFYELCVWVRVSLNSSLLVLFDSETFVLQKYPRPHYFVGALWSKVESELDTLRRLHEFVKHQTLKKICRI